jgi:predicted DNA-binding transcriptional regulator AlpA
MDDREDFYAAADGPKRRPRPPSTAERNRELIAERVGWPTGAIDVCRRIENDFPGWAVWWSPANPITGYEHPDGYVAQILDAGSADDRVSAFGETPQQLVDQIRATGAGGRRAGSRSPVTGQRYMGRAEIAARLGVRPEQAFAITRQDSFPEPGRLTIGEVWATADVEAWISEHWSAD